MHIFRTRFKKEVVTEFLPPLRKTKRDNVIIFAGGMPGYPDKKNFIEFFARKGFWVFVPRYRGTWESDGVFLKNSPHQDILDIIDELPKGFISLFDYKKFKIKPNKIFVFGSSFGGPSAIFASMHPKVNKAVLFSPVVDWTYPSKTESLKFMKRFVSEAFGNGYRITKNGWEKLYNGKFYNPSHQVHKIDGSKLLLFHSLDDDVVNVKSVIKFAKQTNAKLKLFKKGGHFGSSAATKPTIYKLVHNFLINNKNIGIIITVENKQTRRILY